MTTPRPTNDVQRIVDAWRDDLNLARMVATELGESGDLDLTVDLVAVGKAAREMAAAAAAAFGSRLRRRLVIVDEARGSDDDAVLVAEHPVPGPGSLRAAERLIDFLDGPTTAACTVFMISGGASSLCALPAPPLDLADLASVWAAALTTGVDITVLNRLRASVSALAGGAVLRHVRTDRSLSLIMVDNVISGARWVASGLTYDYRPDAAEVRSLLDRVGLLDTDVGAAVLRASDHHNALVERPARVRHQNRVVAEPAVLLSAASEEARRCGYRVVSVGGNLHGDVADVAHLFAAAIDREARHGDACCVIGVGEVTVSVHGDGLGGRCQELAWSMAPILGPMTRDCVFAARASDGRDFLAGVGGAWVDPTTLTRARDAGFDWSDVLERHDSHAPLAALGQLFDGAPTGWNLCDLYVACVGPPATGGR
ncbi:MAG: DUF4147 domain-containing protein [Acidimicrobiales bacterium]